MPWSNPRTWNAGELVTASHFNQEIRDNLQHLYSRPKAARYENNPGYTTTATDWTNVSTFFITVASTGADILVFTIATLYFTNGGAATDFALLRAICDGVGFGAIGRTQRYNGNSVHSTVSLASFKSAPGSGNRVFRPQWMVGGTAGLTANLYQLEMFAIEV